MAQDLYPHQSERLDLGIVNDEQPDPDSVEDSEDYPTNEDGEPLCIGKTDGQCGRVVDEPGGKCWQHVEDDG